MIRMPGILITGTSGFIGNNFSALSKYRHIKSVSLRDTPPRNIDFSGFDTVLNLAAAVHGGKCKKAGEYFSVNRDLAEEFARCARNAGIRHFIQMSTTKVYGRFIEGSDPWDETSPCFPTDPYGRSKYEAELLLKKLEDENFMVSIIRTPLVYGPGVKANMLNLIRLVEKFRTIPLGGVNNLRNFTCVENLSGFIDRIIEKKASGTFIAMDEKPVSTTELIQLIAAAMNKYIRLVRIPEPLVSTGKIIHPGLFEPLFGSVILNNDQTLKALDFHPPVTTEEGIRRMVRAYLSE